MISRNRIRSVFLNPCFFQQQGRSSAVANRGDFLFGLLALKILVKASCGSHLHYVKS